MFVSFESSPSAGPSALGIARGLPTLRRILLPHSYDHLTVGVFYSISCNMNLSGQSPKFSNNNFTILVHSRQVYSLRPGQLPPLYFSSS